MPLYIKVQATADLVTKLARRQGTTKQAAVKAAVQTALDHTPQPLTMRESWRNYGPSTHYRPPPVRLPTKLF